MKTLSYEIDINVLLHQMVTEKMQAMSKLRATQRTAAFT